MNAHTRRDLGPTDEELCGHYLWGEDYVAPSVEPCNVVRKTLKPSQAPAKDFSLRHLATALCYALVLRTRLRVSA
jgi:hypothetical protein